MQMTVDGCVAGPEGQLDWMTWDMDEKLLAFINQLTDTSDTILLGRKMAPGFLQYWEAIVNKPESPEYAFARKMVDTPKIVFTKTLDSIDGQNVRVEKGDLNRAIEQLKKAPGKDMIVYGGAGFVSSLIENSLIDELNFFVNPVGIGNGLRVFKSRKRMALTNSVRYPCGIVVNSYKPKE
jgi:dihydrofolate reductase